MSEYRVIESDCIEAMAAMPESSIDAIVTDPPYGLEFMGKDWDGANGFRRSLNPNDVSRDNAFGRASARGPEYRAGHSFQAFSEAWGREALRVLRPGGYILAFGGTRTYHRLASGLEDAGFKVRDMVEWLYGSGFPKHESCLKPAHEPIMLGRKAAPKSTPLQIDACRIPGVKPVMERTATVVAANAMSGESTGATSTGEMTAEGRWPANVVLDVDAAAMLDAQTGELHSQDPATRQSKSTVQGVTSFGTGESIEYADRGGASRFFYCAKASRDERNAGLDGFKAGRSVDDDWVSESRKDAPGGGQPSLQQNIHPTVKPIDLMRWLVRLVTPPGGTVLDPFTGSGTTGCAAVLEDFDFIGIEREAEYAAIARARIAHWWKQPVQLGLEAA